MKLCLDKELREIGNTLEKINITEQFKLEQFWTVSLNDIRQAFLKYNPRIVHFSGYGITIQIKGLAVEDDVGVINLVRTDDLKKLYNNFSKIECIILNLCFSEEQANTIVQHIDYVIGLKPEIGDQAAFEFNKGFYAALRIGKSIEESFKFGCNSITSNYIPVIYNKKTKLESLREYRTEAMRIIIEQNWKTNGQISQTNSKTLENRRLRLRILKEEALDIEKDIIQLFENFKLQIKNSINQYVDELYYSYKNSDTFNDKLRQELSEFQNSLGLGEEAIANKDERIGDYIISILYVELGYKLLEQEQLYKAQIIFEEAAKIYKNNTLAYEGLAVIWFKKQQYDKALAELNKVKKIYNNEKMPQKAKEIDFFIDKIPISNRIIYLINTIFKRLK